MKIDANFWSGFKEDLAIQDVNTAMLSQPTLFAKWSQEYSEAYTKREDLKWVLDKTYAVINERVRNDPNAGKLTEARVEALVIQSPEYIAAKEEFLTAQAMESALKLVLQAVTMKKDMLISLSANQREELSTGVARMFESSTAAIRPIVDHLNQAVKQTF